MPTPSVAERFEQIDRIASRTHSLVTVLIHHFCIPDRPSELGDAQLVDVLELIEDQLQQVLEQSCPPDAGHAQGGDA